MVEPLFPCYLFVRCVLDEKTNEIRYTTGVSSLVHFGGRIPPVPDAVIGELKDCFEAEAPLPVGDRLVDGAEVVLADGALAGMRACVLRTMPARQRVQVLLDILGRTTLVEVDRRSVILETSCVADRIPLLAAPRPAAMRI